MKLKLIKLNEKEKSYSVLAEQDNKLYIIIREADGSLYTRKAWYENNELLSKDWTRSYETIEEYSDKLETLRSIPKL